VGTSAVFVLLNRPGLADNYLTIPLLFNVASISVAAAWEKRYSIHLPE
jgi:hypothetical protein